MMFLQEEKLRVYLFRYQHIEVHTEISHPFFLSLFSWCSTGDPDKRVEALLYFRGQQDACFYVGDRRCLLHHLVYRGVPNR